MLFRIRRPASEPAAAAAESGVASTVSAPPEAPSAAEPVADPIPFRQKGQLTGQDARAERLVLGVRSEVSELRSFVDGLRERAGDAFSVDIEAVIADPALAMTVPPRLFVDQILYQRDRIAALEAALTEATQAITVARDHHHELALQLAVAEVRRDTLGDVIAAMHANLEDLRATHLPPAAVPPARSPQITGQG